MAVAAVTREGETATVLEWLPGADPVVISDWTMTEAVAGLSQKQRMGIISAEEHGQALAALRRQIAEAYESVPLTKGDFRLAERFAGRAETGLRAGDALHLAVASAAGATLVTLDRKQARGGETVQVPTLLLGGRGPISR